MGDVKRRKGRESWAEYVHCSYFEDNRISSYKTGWKSRKKCPLCSNGKFGIQKFIYYLSTEELVYRRNASLLHCCFLSRVILELGFFFFICFTRENKSIPHFLPLVSLLHWKPPWHWYSSTGSQKTVPSVHTMVPPAPPPYPPFFPQT